jgi:hypothetical protein
MRMLLDRQAYFVLTVLYVHRKSAEDPVAGLKTRVNV